MFLSRISLNAVWMTNTKMLLKIGTNYGATIRSTLCNTMVPVSKLASIDNTPMDPVELFANLTKAKAEKGESNQMSIATRDEEYGVLNRIVIYRGLTDKHMTFVTEKNSRKYENIKKDPRVAVTYDLGVVQEGYWQIRVCGVAIELNADQIRALWNEEPIFAKIRSRICECGKPVDHSELQQAHDTLLEAYNSGKDPLPQTETYTAFKIVPVMWDFYKSNRNSIADRLQYRKDDSQDNKWNIIHVAP